MKSLLAVFSVLISANLFAASYEGVPMNCLEKAEARMAKYKKMGLVAVCRSRHEPNKEFYTFGNGSSLTGFTADSKKSCQFSDWWDAQDDQDQTDPTEWKENCLTEEDFKKPVQSKELKATKTNDYSVVSDSREYTFSGETKGVKTLALAEVVGKQIRREYYQDNYEVEGFNYEEVTYKNARLDLSKKDGEFPGLSKEDLASLDRWFEDHSVAAVVRMDLTTEYMSGTGMESNYIFIPSEAYEPILVVKKFVYAE